MVQVGDMEGQGQQLGIFLNTYRHSLDPKKRMTIPSQWRGELGPSKTVYVMPSVKARYLNVFPASVMAQILDRIKNLSMADEEGRQMVRVLGSQSELLTWDSQGRIRISDELLGYAGVTDQVVMAGVIQSFEIWDSETWAKVKSSDPSAYGDAVRRVGI
jgi:MraZ protein